MIKIQATISSSHFNTPKKINSGNLLTLYVVTIRLFDLKYNKERSMKSAKLGANNSFNNSNSTYIGSSNLLIHL